MHHGIYGRINEKIKGALVKTPLSNVFTVGEYTVEKELNTLSMNGHRLVVEPKVMALLYYLSCHANEVISRDKLMEDVWRSQVSEGAVNRVVGLLRKALSDDADSPRYIQTIAKKGYRLIAEVKSIEEVKQDLIASNQINLTFNTLILSSNKALWFGLFILLTLLALYWQNLASSPQHTFNITNPKFEQLTSKQGFEYDASLSTDEQWLVYRHRKEVTQPYHLYLKKRDQQQSIKLTDTEYNDRSPALSHDKTKIIFFRKGQNSCHLNLLTLDENGQSIKVEELYQCGAVEHYSNVVWAPDDLSVYFTDRVNSSMPYQIYQLHLSTLKIDEITGREDNYYGDNELALSPSGEQLLFFRNKYWGNNQVFIKNVLTKEQRKITELGFLSWTPSWTPDEQGILFSDNRVGGKLKLLDITTGDIKTVYQSAQAINSPQLSVSGKSIVYSNQTADVNIWQVNLGQNNLLPIADKEMIKLAINSSQIDSQPVYSKDGSSLLFLSSRNGEMQLWLQKADGISSIDTLPDTIKIDTYTWHPDGIQVVVASSDKQLYLLNIQMQTASLMEFKEHNVAFPSFSADGGTLYFTSDKSGDWQIWSYNFLDKSIMQITQKGGFQVNADNVDDNGGKLYYTKYRQQGLWALDFNTKLETRIVDNISRSANFEVCSSSLYYLVETDEFALWQMSLKTAKTQKIISSSLNSRFTFDLADECQKLTFSRWENIESDIIMLKL
jgi:Tol biopolymer transport system component/DNA-binding winged helix-turn-helix (wHTH) protein